MSADGKTTLNAREIALIALVRHENDRSYLNLVLPSLTRNLSILDRSLAYQLASGTVQRLNTLDWAINLYASRKIDRFTTWIRNLLRLGAYQILYLDRIPAYAVIDEAVRLARRYGHRGVAGLTNALLRRLSWEAETLPWPDPSVKEEEYFSLRYSIPSWLVKRALERFTFTEAEEWCRSLNITPDITIRPNLVRVDVEDLIGRLAKEGITAVPGSTVPGMLRLVELDSSPAETDSFKEGLYTIQGESSALVAQLLKPGPGNTILDLCSAPGGKSSHLAELMNDEGLVYAVDLHQSRLRLVEKTAKRLGLQSIQIIEHDGKRISDLKLKTPDAVLVDAPCSGLGVVRRLPEIKWRRSEEDLLNMQQLQLDLLKAASAVLKKGGKLLYSVCSTEPEETVAVAEKFICNNPGFSPDPPGILLPSVLQDAADDRGYVTLWPHRHNLDGFFISRWQKN